eukprot:1858879-Lingulodinium_polyedra.AAC.1
MHKRPWQTCPASGFWLSQRFHCKTCGVRTPFGRIPIERRAREGAFANAGAGTSARPMSICI